MRSSPAIAYRQQIEAKQRTVLGELASRNIRVTGSDVTLVNAVFVIAPASRLEELKSIPGVAAVRPMRRFKPSLNRATQLMNGPLAWNALGGVANAGKGIKIGLLDSGIDQTHPAFQDSTLSAPAGFSALQRQRPTRAATPTAGDCGAQLRAPACGILIQGPGESSRRHFGRTVTRLLDAGRLLAARSPGPWQRPRHPAPRRTPTPARLTFTGMAPKAWLGNYKLSGSPGVNDGPPTMS